MLGVGVKGIITNGGQQVSQYQISEHIAKSLTARAFIWLRDGAKNITGIGTGTAIR